MTAKLAATLICAVAFGSSAPALAAGTKEAGQAKSTPCIACHGIDGNSANPEWPSIAGQHESYTVRQLKAFRDGVRQNPLMSPMAAGLSDQDIADLAALYSSQTARGGEAEPSKVKLGQKVYRAGNAQEQTMACAACHGPTGRGNPLAGYPAHPGPARDLCRHPVACLQDGLPNQRPEPDHAQHRGPPVRGRDRRGGILCPGFALNPAPFDRS